MVNQQPWRQVGSQWEQELSFMGRFYAFIAPDQGQLMQWMIASTVKFSYTGPQIDLVATLRKAWVETRYHVPAIAAQVENGKKTYQVATDAEISSWLAASFQVHDNESPDDVFRNIVLTPYMTLHVFPKSQQISLTAAHYFADGRGILYLYNVLFRALATPGEFQFGDEPARLPLTENDLLGVHGPSTEKDQAVAQELLGRFQIDKPICMPVADVLAKPTSCARRELKLSVETTQDVIRICKAKGYSVTSAWHAAVILTTAEAQHAATGSAGSTFATFSNFDLRPYFPASFDARLHPISAYHSGVPLRSELEDGKSFDELSLELRKKYQTELTKEVIHSLPVAGNMIEGLFANGPPPSSTPVLSSIGVVENFLSRSFGPHWQIEDVSMADSMLTAQLQVFLWTWRDRLVLNTSFNHAFYTDDEADTFLQSLKRTLLRGLGLVDH